MSHPLVSPILQAVPLPACSRASARRTTDVPVASVRIRQCLDHRNTPDCPIERQRNDAQQARIAEE